MTTINIHDAKTHFSKLVDSAMDGKHIVIAKAGKPAAVLGPIPKSKIHFGVMKGKIKIKADFDAPLPDNILNEFEGK